MGTHRKFWKNYMPRLKFHNPKVEMDVFREKVVGGPAILTIEFGELHFEPIPLAFPVLGANCVVFL
jgi:hypothetical protein